MTDSVIQLRCECNNYPWGKQGRQSLAATLCSKTPGALEIDNDEHYAEMWMGTYPKQPGRVLATGQNLQDVLDADKERLIGRTVLQKFGTDLPFLPKILSIAKALPLQIHPDKDLAARLHAKDPDKFTDPNHKPEIAIALTKFEAFFGFKPRVDIQQLLKLPALEKFRPPEDNRHWNAETERRLCGTLLKTDDQAVVSAVEGLSKTPRSQLGNNAYILDLLPRITDQYGKGDNGILVALIMMNYGSFEPGEAICIPADGIHAWFAGDIVECMARSDVVLNTGFCPRPDRDSVDLFTSALTFQQHDPKKPVLARVESEYSSSGKTTAFKPPLGEFDMLVTMLKHGERDTIQPIDGPSILFVTRGDAVMTANGHNYDLKEGFIYFVGCGTATNVEAKSDFEAYRAYAT